LLKVNDSFKKSLISYKNDLLIQSLAPLTGCRPRLSLESCPPVLLTVKA